MQYLYPLVLSQFRSCPIVAYVFFFQFDARSPETTKFGGSGICEFSCGCCAPSGGCSCAPLFGLVAPYCLAFFYPSIFFCKQAFYPLYLSKIWHHVIIAIFVGIQWWSFILGLFFLKNCKYFYTYLQKKCNFIAKEISNTFYKFAKNAQGLFISCHLCTHTPGPYCSFVFVWPVLSSVCYN